MSIESQKNKKIEIEPKNNEIIPQSKIDSEKGEKFYGGRFIKKALAEIRDAFREILVTKPKEKELASKMGEELGSIESAAIREGVDFSRCQFEDIFESKFPVEFESFSPYLADYNLATGEIWEDKLTKTDQIGIAIAKMLRGKFPEARMISLYDEYNTDMPYSSDIFGRPTSTGPQIKLPESTKINFRENIKEFLEKKGLIKLDDKEGKNFLLISESEKIKDAEELVKKLEELEKLKNTRFIKRDGEAIYFVNEKAENPLYREITLRTKNGRWLCEALDASSYIKEENKKITHLVVLPNHFKEQQDKVWEMLRVLGIDSTHYHNIFYDEKVDTETITRVIREEIEKYKK